VILLGLIPLAIGTAFYVMASYPPAEVLPILGHITPARILTLALGSLLAFHEAALHRRPWLFVALGLLGAVLGYACALAGFLLPKMQPTVGLQQLVGLAIMSASVVLLFILGDRLSLPRASRILGAPLAYIGRISYGLYLYHLPIFHALGTQSNEPMVAGLPGRVALAIGLSLAAASLSYYAFERPLIQWGARFRGLPKQPKA
jgi:peptidoglycan/LPS O-acetylase OafA/YrhL